MLINTYYHGLEIHREDKIIYARFLLPHQVLSNCRAAGGFQTGLNYIYNHQSCEPAGHSHRLPPSAWRDASAYRQMVSECYDLPAQECTTLGTAANMNHAAFVCEKFRNVQVIAVCTGGVEANAGRAGDPASVYETAEGFEKLSPDGKLPGPGTINTMIFINKPLIPGAMVRVIMTATGTGTDQIAVAALQSDEPPLTSAGKHAKLGELIGRVECDILIRSLTIACIGSKA